MVFLIQKLPRICHEKYTLIAANMRVFLLSDRIEFYFVNGLVKWMSGESYEQRVSIKITMVILIKI